MSELRRWLAVLFPAIVLLFARESAAAGPSGGRDEGARSELSFHSRDGNAALSIHARIQPRVEIERAEDTTSTVLQVRRARLKLSGHVFGVHRRFYVQLGLSPRDLEGGIDPVDGQPVPAPLRDARLEFGRVRDATVWVGLMKVPFSRERMVSDAKLGMIDRSIVNAEFNLDRDIGVVVRSDDLGGLGSRLGYAVGVFGGDGRNAFEPTQPRFLYVARLELRPLGPLADGGGGDLARSTRPRVQIGLAHAFHDDAQAERGTHGERPEDRDTTDLHLATVDAVVKWRGVAIEGALIWRHGRRPHVPGWTTGYTQPRNGLGWFVQLGVLLPRTPVELVGRYASVLARARGSTSLTSHDEFGIGVNVYLGGHDLKLQADYAHGLDRSRPWAAVGDTLRVQVQLAI